MTPRTPPTRIRPRDLHAVVPARPALTSSPQARIGLSSLVHVTASTRLSSLPIVLSPVQACGLLSDTLAALVLPELDFMARLVSL